jgi:hypothetical protein
MRFLSIREPETYSNATSFYNCEEEKSRIRRAIWCRNFPFAALQRELVPDDRSVGAV